MSRLQTAFKTSFREQVPMIFQLPSITITHHITNGTPPSRIILKYPAPLMNLISAHSRRSRENFLRLKFVAEFFYQMDREIAWRLARTILVKCPKLKQFATIST